MFSRLFNRRDEPVPIPDDDLTGPGPIERTRWAQRYFKRHGRWPAEVVEERLFRDDVLGARMRRAWEGRTRARGVGMARSTFTPRPLTRVEAEHIVEQLATFPGNGVPGGAIRDPRDPSDLRGVTTATCLQALAILARGEVEA